jgi:very-short-patch-repair endonuclease/nucleoside 2-deoxyribosyltransferase
VKIYLAGKIAQNDWRHDIVQDPDELDEMYYRHPARDEWSAIPIPRTDLAYVGPYFEAQGHGGAHALGHHGTTSAKRETAERCRAAIRNCDVFFAWLECETAHGTMVEIGYAYALGKKIIIARPQRDSRCDECYACLTYGCQPGNCNCDRDELWFALEHATAVIHADDAVTAFQTAARQLQDAMQVGKCESPLEEMFYKTYLGCSPSGAIRQELQGLTVQHKVTIGDQNYRLDFALPGKKIAFEMDGYTYHGKEREHFNRDRRRDLDLKLNGWEVHRFDGDMIRNDVVSVLEIAAKLASAR